MDKLRSFGDLDRDELPEGGGPVALLPLLLERTTSWGKGTARGPEAILNASAYLELYDEELDWEPASQGIATLAPMQSLASKLEDVLDEIETRARPLLEGGKFLVGLGGEHTVTVPLVRAARHVHPGLGVVQFDAHADLRDEYEGSPYSHACVMRRLLDEGVSTLAVGVRSLSSQEKRLVRERELPVLWGHDLHRASELLPELLDRLPETVYLTFDVDFFDPSLLAATGTPEPGGGFWYPTLELLRILFARKRVVAMDVVELSPLPQLRACDFVVAKLIYKCIGYHLKRTG